MRKNEILKKVFSIWQEELKEYINNVEVININDDFIEIGGDSLRLMNVFGKIENEFEIRIEEEDMYGHRTIGQQTTLILNLLSQ